MNRRIVDERGNETSLSAYQKNKLYEKANRLRENIKETVCTREECRNPTDKNVQKMLNGEFKIKQDIETFRKSMQAIGADPRDYNVEKLRR